jgi:hypothetical protein
VIDEVGGRLRATPGCEIFGAGAGHDPDGADARRNHGAGGERPYADRDIDPVLDGVENPITEQKTQSDIGIGLLELAGERQEMKMSDPPRRCYGEIACRSPILA